MSNRPTITLSHGGHTGDIIYGMAYAKAIQQSKNHFADIYISNNRRASIREGMWHPNGTKYNMTEAAFNYVAPLLRNEEWVTGVQFIADENMGDAIPLDDWRRFEGLLNSAAGNIAVYARKVSGLPVDVENPWLTIPLHPEIGKVVCAFSTRYRNTAIDYSVLSHANDVVFIGLDNEFENFKQISGLHNLRRAIVGDALETANEIASAHLFLGNQSSSFAIAEAIKVKRALECFEPAPNVIPCGPFAADYITNHALQTILKREGLLHSLSIRGSDLPGFQLDTAFSGAQNSEKRKWRLLRRKSVLLLELFIGDRVHALVPAIKGFFRRIAGSAAAHER